jgi:methylenetetrahydrofolate reductase (NADH)
LSDAGAGTVEPDPLARWLREYSAEVTTPDRRALDDAAARMPPRSRVYVAALPKDSPDRQVDVCRMVNQLGLVPVPHLVARNIENRQALDYLLQRLTTEADVDRALVLGGDRDDPAGDYSSALELIESGALQSHGIGKIAIAGYPEGHPRIADELLEAARTAKIAAAERAGLEVILITQLCFEAKPIVEYLRRLRAAGITQRVRIGLAGPASRKTLLRYAMICGVGASLRALKERQSLARNLLASETPERLLADLAAAVRSEPSLDIWGVHFFTFASLADTIEWAAGRP